MSPPKYRIDFAQVVGRDLRLLALRAIRNGLLGPFTAALREIRIQLESDPITWGDPLYLLPVFGWLLYQRAINPLHVSFGVDDDRKIVYVRWISPFPGGGLESVP